jgi:hypothetical protein
VRADSRDTSTPDRKDTAAMVSGSSDTGTKSNNKNSSGSPDDRSSTSSSSHSGSNLSQGISALYDAQNDPRFPVSAGYKSGTWANPLAHTPTTVNASGSPDDRDRFASLREYQASLDTPSSSNPVMDYLGGLGTSIHDFLQAPYNARVAANGGNAPFEGGVDWKGIYDYLQKPANDRMAREAAASGGLPEAAAPMVAATGTGGLYDAQNDPRFPVSPGFRSGTWANPDRLASTPLNVNAVAPPYTGTEAYSEERLPSGAYVPTPATAAIDHAASVVPLPRLDPRGYTPWAPAVTAPYANARGTTDTFGATPGPGYASSPAAQPSVWDGVVDNTGKLLSHTGLGAVVSTLFPDFWKGAGDTMKGLGANGAPGGPMSDYPTWDAERGTWKGNDADKPNKNGPRTPNFPDLNHNGVDDRKEGYTGPDTNPPVVPLPTLPAPVTGGTGAGTGSQFDTTRYVSFPGASYQPGIDNEWTYFRDHLARGGIVGFADGGAVADPRVALIADAEDALHRGDHGHESITRFVDSFGPKALETLHANVREGLTMRPRGRVVTGPGGPTDDAIPAIIDGRHPAALSSGEFIFPTAAVEGIGEGDPRVGAQRLQELVARFGGAK